MFKVVLDASALMTDYELTAPYSQALLAEGEASRLALVVPEVALAEVRAGYRRELIKSIGTVNSARKGLKRLGVEVKWLRIEVEPTVDLYMARLTKRLEEAGADIATAPEVPHMELVDRAVHRRRPFDDQGSGYRDALIWYTVLDLVDAEGIALVCADSDFYEAPGSAALAPDLLADLPEADSVVAYRTIADCVKELIKPAQELQGLIQGRVATDEPFREAVLAKMKDALVGLPLETTTMPEWATRTVDLKVGDVLAMSQPQIGNVLAYAHNEVVVAMSAEAEIVANALAPVDEIEHLRGDGIVASGDTSGASFGSVTAMMRVEVELAGIYDTMEAAFLEVEPTEVIYVGTRWDAARGSDAPS